MIITLLLLGFLAPVVPPAVTQAARSTVVDVYPTPQAVRGRPEVVRIPKTVNLVAGDQVDASALAVVREAIESAGARTIRQADERQAQLQLLTVRYPVAVRTA